MMKEGYGCKLVGMIPVSDDFGVDLLLEEYENETTKGGQKVKYVHHEDTLYHEPVNK